jgi:putative hemolysin
VEPDPYSLLIFGISVLVVMLVVVADMAIAAASRSEIRKMSEAGNAQAQTADELMSEPARLLITTTLLKGAGFVGVGAAMVKMLPAQMPWMQLLGALFVVWLTLASLQAMSRVFVHNRAEVILVRLALFLRLSQWLVWPVAAWMRWLSNRVSSDEQVEHDEPLYLSENGLRMLVNVDGEDIPESEKEMIASILEMDETVARELMVPRIDIVAISAETSMHDALNVIIEAGHSRIPVYEGNIDRVVGVLYAKDLLRCYQTGEVDIPVMALVRPVYFVPASKKVNQLLREMQKQRNHIAMVVDEYGGIAGLVTIEDILEEIVGDIQDEYDVEEETEVQALGPYTYLVSARIDVYSLSKLLDVELPDEDADTLGGMIYSLLGHVPEPGEAVTVHDWRFTVLSLEGRRIDQVRAELTVDVENARAEADLEESVTNDRAFNLSTSDQHSE